MNRVLYNPISGESWSGEAVSYDEAIRLSGFPKGLSQEVTEDDLASLKHGASMDEIHGILDELEEALKSFRESGHSDGGEHLTRLAAKVMQKVQRESGKNIYWIAWIKHNGHTLQKVIDTGKKNGERLLHDYQLNYSDAVIEWKGPMDYTTGRQMLEMSN